MSSRGYRQDAPAPLATTTSGPDDDYDYSTAIKGTSYEDEYKRQNSPQRKSPPKPEDPRPSSTRNVTDDPLLDLEQLEELHEEAERMKALGNKHMASQEFTRAYNAYSAALQLSPVGPSSHVFLCNRAAALLSLKRYAAAATDARRAIALAPTFGKAHARLGQSLYFLKDYEGAVASYEEAVRFEPDNSVTQTYLDKAKSKLARQHEKARRAARGDEVSVTEDSVAPTVVNSVATDPNRSAGVVKSSNRGNQQVLMAAAARHTQLPNEVNTGAPVLPSPLAEDGAEGEFQDDPDFDQAVRIQESANRLLAAKRYKEAIESYSAALFLVPDDPYLSPELHLGRAHALNGSHRHESAKNDSLLAIKINPTSEAYSTLAKSLFYMKDYLGAVAAFEDCMDLLPQGESLSMFDQAYLRKAEAAWQEELENNPDDARSMASSKASSTTIPKLPPPRFVPREKAVNETPSIPPMPKQWPQQPMASPTALKVGPERNVTFLSEALGIKLNRGNDGIVRVLSVSPETASSKIARSGTIEAGDVVREAAGVDIRRPITNIMWGDTIALVKIAPRPITMIVAKELSEVPQSVLEEKERALAEESMSPAAKSARRGEPKEEEEEYMIPPSPAVGDESVRDSIAMANEKASHAGGDAAGAPNQHHVSDTNVDSSSAPVESMPNSTNATVDSLEHSESETAKTAPNVLGPISSESQEDDEAATSDTFIDVNNEDVATEENEAVNCYAEKRIDSVACKENMKNTTEEMNRDGEAVVAAMVNERDVDADVVDGDEASEESSVHLNVEEAENTAVSEPQGQLYSHDEEMQAIGAEILFEKRADEVGLDDWSNLRWLSTSGERQLRFAKVVTRTTVAARKGLFRPGQQQLLRRKLAIFEKPNLIMLLRPPASTAEVRKLLDLPDGVALEDEKNALKAFLVAETVIDPVTCMLRLSQLTTVTSVGNVLDEKLASQRRFYLELVTPTETIALSALSPDKQKIAINDRALPGGPAFLQTASLENAIANALYHAHRPHADPNGIADEAWKHQVVQGTLHSYVLSGNNAMLEKASKAAVGADTTMDGATKHVPPNIIDARDESSRTALHYACLRRASQAVSLLTRAGASCSIPLYPGGFFPSHLSALVHDEKSLSVILSATYPSRPDPNQFDSLGRTPMYLAAVEGKQPLGEGGASDSLGRCLSALAAWGGELVPSDGPIVLRHPVSVLASRWAKSEMAAVLAHVRFRHPLENAGLSVSQHGMSLGALFQYPLHSALVTLRRRIRMVGEDVQEGYAFIDDRSPESGLVGTVRVLLEHGFEVNERLEGVIEDFDGAADLIEFTGYSPMQILAVAALDADSLNDSVGVGLKQCISQTIAGAAELLVQCGARLTLDPPPLMRLQRSASSASDRSDAGLADEEVRACLKIDGNKTLMRLLGGEDRLREAKDHWLKIKSVDATARVLIQKEASKGNLGNSEAPGGSDERSCAICWTEFGTLMNRKQKCKVSMRYVCDECSSKRVSVGKEEHRVSDGQFCLARVDAARSATDAVLHEKAQAQMKVEKARASREAAAMPSDEDNRDSLFGSMIEKATNLVLGEEDAAELTGRQVEGLSGQLNQTRDALNERGDKLSSLGEKTSQLADSSREFAKMAKELERSQKGGLFW